MKTRFNTVDIKAMVSELKLRLLGMRVANVYDIDNKTYLIKLAKPDHKAMLLLESGNRLHPTDFEWPKNMSPSGFSMKLRKHLRTRRLETVEQLGIDRIVDLQFGSGEAAYHVILELYDRGNIVLTDFEYTILNILRPRTDESQDVRFAVREKYPIDGARQHEGVVPEERLRAILMAAKDGDNLKKILNPHLVYGAALIEHCLLQAGVPDNARLGKEFLLHEHMPNLVSALRLAEGVLEDIDKGIITKGYILTKSEKKLAKAEGQDPEEITTYVEFHPLMFKQHQKSTFVELESFGKSVDEFFSKLGSQKLDMKVLQQEKAAMKKLENVKKDHVKRLDALQTEQDNDKKKAELIEINLDLVDKAIKIVQSAVANQIDWAEIQQIVKEAQAQGDPVAGAIKTLKLDSNHITMLLRDPYVDSDEEVDEDGIKPMKLDIDLSLSAYANARKFYDMKRHASVKEQKTVSAAEKALKSAEKKTKQTLKDVATIATINKARKTYWFEKFLWFISSENYLVIGGRDQQQNEFIVKRHLKPGDLYVHADLHGASTLVIKNPSGEPVPPKTLNEAGTMAVCNSAAWDAKVVTSAWWVRHDQVSKTAPTGEYLSTGSFMVRGKKNFLPPSYLIYGFSFLFKLDEDSLFRHKDERRVRTTEEDAESLPDSMVTESEMSELSLEGDDDNEGDDSSSDNEDQEENDNKCDSKSAIESSEPKLSEPAESISENNLQETEQTSGISENINLKEEEKQTDSLGENSLQQTDSDPDKEMSHDTELTNQDQDSSDEEDSLFPDTAIALQHVEGDKFTLQRNVSRVSASEDDDGKIYLGDDEAIILGENVANNVQEKQASSRLSAKQRRMMKKKSRQAELGEEGDQDEVVGESGGPAPEERLKPAPQASKKQQQQQQQQQQQLLQPKRGQKTKLKKIKEKYKDQDEEERQLKMEILASAGPQKEEKKKKGKKGRQQQLELKKQQQQKQGATKQTRGPGSWVKLTESDIKVETPTTEDLGPVDQKHIKNPVKEEEDEGQMSDDEKQAILEEENIQGNQDANILDSLTGAPVPDDILLFCVPVCAPYSTLNNYKYKVKLMPGTTRRGKAAKTALHMFMNDKACTPREKELLRSVKDTDLSRHMPGKVKVSAPNLQRQKKKK